MPNNAFKIAKRLYFSDNEEGARRQSKPAVRVALIGMIVGVMVMILTFCIVVGFKRTVTEKVAGFGSHIQVISYHNNDTYDLQPVEISDSLLERLGTIEHVTSATPFITKPGMLKTDSAFHGIVLKGTDYTDFFAQNIVQGRLPQQDLEVLLSDVVAREMQVRVGDTVLSYFVDENNVRARRFIISGIYDTGFTQYDDLFVIATLSTVRRLQNWDEYVYSGVDILVGDMDYLYETAESVRDEVMYNFDEFGYNLFYVKTLEEMNPTIFSWLDLLDMNVIVIIILMLSVAGFNIISGLIILILEGVQLIGTLKALGADNAFVRRVFLIQAAMLIGKGVIWGNILGLGLAAMQYFGHWIPLEAATYYVDTVPIAFPWGWLLALNAVTIALSLLVLLLPSMIIAKIEPAKVMHFE